MNAIPVRGENDHVPASLYVQDGKSTYQRERRQEKEMHKRQHKSASCMRSTHASKLALSYHDDDEQVEADLAQERMLNQVLRAIQSQEERALCEEEDVDEEEQGRAHGRAFGGAGGCSSSDSVVFGS